MTLTAIPEGFPRCDFRPSTPFLLFQLSDIPSTYFTVLCIFQNHPRYSSVPPTPENPQLLADPDELPSASSRHDLDADEESLEGGDAESSSSSQRNREGRIKKAMDVDAQDVPEGDGDSTSPAAASPRAPDTRPASSESGALVNSLGVPYVVS